MLSPPHRKCKLVTSGPWLEVAPIALRDVSILPESPGARGGGHGVALWAVSDKGDVLCRLGVSELNPAVSALVPAHPAGPLGFWRILPEMGLLRWRWAGLRPPWAGGHGVWPAGSPGSVGSWSPG